MATEALCWAMTWAAALLGVAPVTVAGWLAKRWIVIGLAVIANKRERAPTTNGARSRWRSRPTLTLGLWSSCSSAAPTGLITLQPVQHGAASTVADVDLKQEKLELACSLGADEGVTGGPAADEALRDISPLGFDVVIDCTGVPSVVEHMFTHVRNE